MTRNTSAVVKPRYPGARLESDTGPDNENGDDDEAPER